MKILVDTQILLWVLLESSRLKAKEKALIADSGNEIICSSISLFEISLKYAIGKLLLKNIEPEKIPDLLLKNGYQIQDVGHNILASFYKLPNEIHKDPFDRILVWQAIQNNMHLMSRDQNILKYQKYGLKIVDS